MPITSKSLTIFRQLKKHNDRDWFNSHKAQFDEHVKAPMIELIVQINRELLKFAPDHVSDPKKAMYRINRDTRFSKDKTPYKNHQGAMFGHRRLPKNYCAGFYFSFGHDEVEIAGGLYMPEPAQLTAVRKAIAENPAGWKKLVTNPSLVKLLGPLQGQKLARPLKGFDPNHPASEWVKMKQFYFYRVFKPDLATNPAFKKEIITRFKAVSGFVGWINNIILTKVATEAGEEPIARRPAPMF